MGYGQNYYTLRSIFMDRIPPPAVHIHLRMFDVASGVPIGDMSASRAIVDGPLNETAGKVEIPDREKEKFDLWLRELWQEKDESITRFLETALFSEAPQPAIGAEIPLKLRRGREIFDAYCFFLPACAGYLWRKVRQ